MARRVSRLPEDVIYLLQAAAVAGPECEAGVVAKAAELTAEQRLDAFDRAVESRLLRRVGQDMRDATSSRTRWYATPFTASSCAGAGSATTTRSPLPPSGPMLASWTPTSTSWPTTSTWAPRWPMPTRPVTTARPPASVRSASWPSRKLPPFRPRPGGGRTVRARRSPGVLRCTDRIGGGAEPGRRHSAGGRQLRAAAALARTWATPSGWPRRPCARRAAELSRDCAGQRGAGATPRRGAGGLPTGRTPTCAPW